MSAALRVVGTPDPEAADAVAEIVGRCAPWARLHVGAALSDRALVGCWRPAGTPDGAGDLLVATSAGQCPLLIAHHECWHVVEGWLAPEALASVTRLTTAGRHYSDPYLSAPPERRARLYAALATAWDEGLSIPLPRGGGAEARAIACMHAVYTGRGARDIERCRARAVRARLSLWRRFWAVVWG